MVFTGQSFVIMFCLVFILFLLTVSDLVCGPRAQLVHISFVLLDIPLIAIELQKHFIFVCSVFCTFLSFLRTPWLLVNVGKFVY